MPSREGHIEVTRTARYHALGPGTGATEAWFVLHGHGQLSAYFIRHFAAIDNGQRLIVAPEALNRFYLEETSWQGAGQARVGATWMTREDRVTEIRDYVAYLDALHDSLRRALATDARVIVLGFSQGVATACRWLAQGKSRAHRLILWAGPLPVELDGPAAAPLKDLEIIRVLGEADEMATPEVQEKETRRFEAAGLTSELLHFSGGHQLDGDTLKRIAG